MSVRQNALHEWLTTILGSDQFTLSPVAGDASFRRYFRLVSSLGSRIVMDAPPEKETIIPFIQLNQLLSKNGVHTPSIYASDSTQGFILLEDLGDELFLKHVAHDHANQLYIKAIETLLHIQQCPTDGLQSFNAEIMLKELSLFPDWFLNQYLGLTLSTEEETLLQETFHWLIAEIRQQPYVFMHRDYHSRNLMITPNDLGVIDFQDAMHGPYTYDLVSLLKDCYIQWPNEKIIGWIRVFYDQVSLPNKGSFSEFSQAFELCGLQRHVRILGTFSRLYLRDNKSQYLNDLPLTFHYVLACLENQPKLNAFYLFMQRVYERFTQVNPS